MHAGMMASLTGKRNEALGTPGAAHSVPLSFRLPFTPQKYAGMVVLWGEEAARWAPAYPLNLLQQLQQPRLVLLPRLCRRPPNDLPHFILRALARPARAPGLANRANPLI